jgi:hypothetical protein
LTKVGSPIPFALSLSKGPCIVSPSNDLSLSKGQAEPAEAFGMWHEGFDKLSPNGDSNGASIPQPERFFADLEAGALRIVVGRAIKTRAA